MPAPKRASSPSTAQAAAPVAVPGPVEASLPWRPLLSQLSDELERLDGENRKLRELLGVPPAPRRHHDEVQALRSKGLLPGGSVVLRNQWMEGEGSSSLATAIPRAPRSEGSKISSAPELGSPTNVFDSRGLSNSNRAGSSNSKQSKLLLPDQANFTIMRAQKTKQFVAEKPWYVINPDSSRLASTWQMIMVASLVFVALVTPIQVGLFPLQLDTLFFVSLGVDFLFLIDLFLQFMTSYPKTTPRGVVWEVSLVKISCNYLRTWFFFDFITLLPFELITLSLGVEELRELTTIKIFRALRLLKLLRLVKTSRIVQDLEVPWSIPYQQMALGRFLLVLGLMCHWLACLWAMTLLLVDPVYPQWIDGIQEADAAYGITTRDSPYRVYVASFYFCTYTLTSVGYGDIGPQNILERTFLSFVVLAAGLSWAYIIGEVGGIVQDITKESQDQGLPFSLQCRLRRFFLQNKHQSLFKARQLLMERMSPQLRAEACIAINLAWLQKVSFFKQFMQHIDDKEWAGEFTGPHNACVYDISRSLQLQAFAQQESFDNVQVLFILSKGLVALNSRVGAHGEVWGEDFVLSDTSLIEPVSGYALTYIELLSLTRDDFMKVIDRRRWTCPELAKVVRRYCIRVAVFRGVLAEARRRLRMQQTSHPQIAKMKETAPVVTVAPKVRPSLPGEVLPETAP
ncbi:Potassium voltage-gated channel subfamily H member 7 [Symbiodinium microadriaticum]|uniref:Potassium voltage-gated channel subfamily H member 7 n=1 Tax=Symbiodinium microadriaticum TaxID=2951 RepID=A0A1Q9F7R9_SYMMI|nr:Potassium voltage-gated channel subfamily H member 7 [Symbiodinium microadriaticum]